jgi:pSer/pThr/pTyr-binding forkhead associated (FHA) protein
MLPTVVITVQEDDRVCQELHFEQPQASCLVGRSSACAVRLPTDPAHEVVSRRHCVLDIEPPFAWVRDLGSLNGTFLNGVCIGARDPDEEPHQGRRYRLYAGDVLRVGNSLLRIDVLPGEPSDNSETIAEHACEACPV